MGILEAEHLGGLGVVITANLLRDHNLSQSFYPIHLKTGGVDLHDTMDFATELSLQK